MSFHNQAMLIHVAIGVASALRIEHADIAIAIDEAATFVVGVARTASATHGIADTAAVAVYELGNATRVVLREDADRFAASACAGVYVLVFLHPGFEIEPWHLELRSEKADP